MVLGLTHPIPNQDPVIKVVRCGVSGALPPPVHMFVMGGTFRSHPRVCAGGGMLSLTTMPWRVVLDTLPALSVVLLWVWHMSGVGFNTPITSPACSMNVFAARIPYGGAVAISCLGGWVGGWVLALVGLQD